MGIASFHALCALNIYLGGNQNYSTLAYGEFLKYMTYQALSQENDSVVLSFDEAINLAHSIVNTLAEMSNEEDELKIKIEEKVKKKLDIHFNAEEEMDSLFSGKEISIPKVKTSTPLSNKQVNAIYDKEKADYLKSSLLINSVDLESASERADLENQKTFQEIIDPTPGLLVDDKINIDEQFNLEQSHDSIFSNSLKASLDEKLADAKKRIENVSFDDSANNIEDIYFDDSFKEMLKTIKFRKLSTDDREDFKVDVKNNEMILFKSPAMANVNVHKKDLNEILKNIVNDFDADLNDFVMSFTEEQLTKQKKTIVNDIIRRLETSPTKNIKKQIEEHSWLRNLVDDQLKSNNTFSFGDYQKNKYKNVTKRKKRHSADYLQYLNEPNIYTLVTPEKQNKIESCKKVFSNIMKNIPPESYKKFKIQYDASNDITVDEL